MTDHARILGVLSLAVTLGSLHAFSVISFPLQAQVGADLSSVSLVYSAAIVSLTAGVLASDWVFRTVSPRVAAIGSAVVAAVGLLLAATASSFAALITGYGLLFGFANGIGYSLFLSEAAEAMPERPGFAVGLATAAYAAGSMLFAWVFQRLRVGDDASAGLIAVALAVAVAGAVAFLVFTGPKRSASRTQAAVRDLDARRTAVLWLIYFFGAISGLLVTAHAAGIAGELGAPFAAETLSVTALATGNILGSILGGRMTDRWSPRACLAMATALAGIASLGLAVSLHLPVVLALLALAGFAYGALISIVPRAVEQVAPAGSGTRAFGRVFTAWGAAGLIGPWLGGVLFDLAGLFTHALLAAAVLSASGALASLLLLGRPQGLPAKA
jgi:OFA family oxalate/formate antiporter-like MFS transporter